MPPLYLVAGLLCDRHVWEAQIAEFAPQHDVRVPDLSEHDSIAAMAAALLREAPPRFALAGHSMGGRVALEVMRQAPERVTRLALLDTGTHPAREGEAQKRRILLELAERDGMAALAAQWLPPMVHPARVADRALMDGLTAMVERRSPAIFRRQVKALLEREDATPLLSAIVCPTLVGVGREDGWSQPSQHEPIAAAITGAQYVIFDDCGHMSTVERPTAVTRALAQWLE